MLAEWNMAKFYMEVAKYILTLTAASRVQSEFWGWQDLPSAEMKKSYETDFSVDFVDDIL